jgi:hypothetical protein
MVWKLFQTGVEMELMEQMPLLEWFANNYKNFGKQAYYLHFASFFFLFYQH